MQSEKWKVANAVFCSSTSNDALEWSADKQKNSMQMKSRIEGKPKRGNKPEKVKKQKVANESVDEQNIGM